MEEWFPCNFGISWSLRTITVFQPGPDWFLIEFNSLSCILADLYDLVDKQTQSLFVEPTLVNHSSRPLVKESSLPINELLEKNVKPGESKLALHPLPKHGDPRQHSQQNKSKKVLKSDRLLEHNSEKTRQLEGLSPKTQVTGAVAANNHHNHNRTVQRTNQESQSNLGPPQQGEAEGQPNYRARVPSQVLPPPPPPPPSPRKEPASRRLDPEENRPGKSTLYQPVAASRNNSRPPAVFNQRSSLLYQLDLLRRGWCFFTLMQTNLIRLRFLQSCM